MVLIAGVRCTLFCLKCPATASGRCGIAAVVRAFAKWHQVGIENAQVLLPVINALTPATIAVLVATAGRLIRNPNVLPVSASELIAADCAASHVRQAGAPGGISGALLVIVA